MSAGDVRTIDKRGQWVNEVEGDPVRSASFTSRDEAIDAGRAIARETGGRHLIEDTEPTGDITDPDPASGDAR
jgi:hypothetical protein